ncbi:hypothetical protein [Sphingorhabdus sp. M41]|uniref:hypothetical protein n=1 Tax=Sphingorhabdus sp. M41 TaxID=1806885 RepID=UPI00078CBFC7|nr:hypothetical protein [Sphingorhabdus sp. M41]AMO71043.1 hypothetical protein AZE99_03475 [Sphingorhabdus sp. M41]
MIKRDLNSFTRREKELFLGHLVTWGAIISAFVLAVVLSPVVAAEQDEPAATIRADADTDIVMSDKG